METLFQTEKFICCVYLFISHFFKTIKKNQHILNIDIKVQMRLNRNYLKKTSIKKIYGKVKFLELFVY